MVPNCFDVVRQDFEHATVNHLLSLPRYRVGMKFPHDCAYDFKAMLANFPCICLACSMVESMQRSVCQIPEL